MTQALTFNDITLTIIFHQNSLWIRAAELARALGYSDDSIVSRLYRKHADEFTPEMTQLIGISAEDQNGLLGNSGRCRIFSLRGCHLVAMFARTPVAKAFRKWVLDVLEKYAAEQTALSSAPGPAATLPLSTTEDRKPLRALVGSWAQVSGLPFAACWNQLKAAFQLGNIKELPQAWLPDALAWVQEKMDTLTAPLPQTNVPTLAPYTPPVGMSTGREDAMRKIESAITAISAAQDVLRLFCHPGAVTMRMTRQERAMYDAEHTLFAHAIDTLYAARCTLEAGHALERLRRPQTGRNLSAGRM